MVVFGVQEDGDKKGPSLHFTTFITFSSHIPLPPNMALATNDDLDLQSLFRVRRFGRFCSWCRFPCRHGTLGHHSSADWSNLHCATFAHDNPDGAVGSTPESTFPAPPSHSSCQPLFPIAPSADNFSIVWEPTLGQSAPAWPRRLVVPTERKEFAAAAPLTIVNWHIIWVHDISLQKMGHRTWGSHHLSPTMCVPVHLSLNLVAFNHQLSDFFVYSPLCAFSILCFSPSVSHLICLSIHMSPLVAVSCSCFITISFVRGPYLSSFLPLCLPVVAGTTPP